MDSIESCTEIPACRGPAVLAILNEVDPVTGDDDSKHYPDRVEKFSRNFIWRRITGEITEEFIQAAVERMFNANEVSSIVDPVKLAELKRQIVKVFLLSS